MHTQQHDPFLPPSPQDWPLARRCHSALGIRAGSPQTPGGHSTHKLCPTTKCPEQGGTVGLRAPAAAWAASPCSRSPLEPCRDSRGPGRPCLSPQPPALSVPLRLPGRTVPSLVLSAESWSRPGFHCRWQAGQGHTWLCTKCSVPAPPGSSQPPHQGQELLFRWKQAAVAAKSQERRPGRWTLHSQLRWQRVRLTPLSLTTQQLSCAERDEMGSGTATEAEASSRQQGKRGRRQTRRTCHTESSRTQRSSARRLLG